MGSIHTEVVRDAHSYTRSSSPWILKDTESVYGRLVHYLSGGGLRTFGRTIRQEEARIRQRRFLIASAVLAALWLWFFFF